MGFLPGCFLCPRLLHTLPFHHHQLSGLPRPQPAQYHLPRTPVCVSALHIPSWPRSQVPKCVPWLPPDHGYLPPAQPNQLERCTVYNVLLETQSHLNSCTYTLEGGIILPIVQKRKLRPREAQRDFYISRPRSSSPKSGALLSLIQAQVFGQPQPGEGKGPGYVGVGMLTPITYWGVTQRSNSLSETIF